MSLFNPWVLLGIAIALALAFLSGMRAQSDRYKAQLLVQERAMHEAYVRTVREQRARAQVVSQELSDATLKRQSDAVAFRAELARAHAGAVQLASCEPGGTGVRLTGEFARLFDAGTSIGVPDSRRSAPAHDAPERARVFAPEDVLAANAENSEICGELRAQVLGFQQWVRGQGWWTK